jgi:predicted nucleotidyltransferase
MTAMLIETSVQNVMSVRIVAHVKSLATKSHATRNDEAKNLENVLQHVKKGQWILPQEKVAR